MRNRTPGGEAHVNSRGVTHGGDTSRQYPRGGELLLGNDVTEEERLRELAIEESIEAETLPTGESQEAEDSLKEEVMEPILTPQDVQEL